MIDDIKKDREAGTPGPWDAAQIDIGSYCVFGPAGTALCIEVDSYTLKECGANTRRIARVPEMEERIIADADRIKEFGKEIDRLKAVITGKWDV
jgi:hypothetical protein